MTEHAIDTAGPAPATGARHEAAMAQMRERQNLGLGIAAGIAAALVGAVLWAAFAYITGIELGIVVVAIGIVIGYAIRTAGRGVDPVFGIVGGACAALSWALGTLLSDVAFLAQQAQRPFLDVLGVLGIGASGQFAMQNLEAMDFVCLAIAVWEGWKFSHWRVRR